MTRGQTTKATKAAKEWKNEPRTTKKAGKASSNKQKKEQVSKKDSEDEDENEVEVSNTVKIMNVE